MMKYNTEEASAGSLIGSIVCIAVVGTVFWVLGAALDKVVGITNAMVLTFSISQDAANTIYMLVTVFAVLPFLYVLALIINYWSTAADESGGGV